jgi:hypothetical protein
MHSRRTLRDPPERLAEVLAATHERHLESVLADVVLVVRHGEDLGLLSYRVRTILFMYRDRLNAPPQPFRKGMVV